MSSDIKEKWIPQNTAILIIHGIGHQEPLETLDSFARGIIEALQKSGTELTLSHKLAKKIRSEGGFWYDNYIRIECPPASNYLDIYEYYWANLTEDKTDLEEIHRWARKVSRGAQEFYEENKELGKKHGDQSFFFDKDGTFRSVRYRVVLWFLTWLVPLFRLLLHYLTRPITFLYPQIADYLRKKITRNYVNLIGDIIIYNAASVRSKNYEIRKGIIDGAVNALRYLVEPVQSSDWPEYHWNYNRVIVSGHSLGSQIAFDAINRLTHFVTQGDVDGFDKEGYLLDKKGGKRAAIGNNDVGIKNISNLLCGLHTFGSPLDKIAFFLREQTEKEEYIRQQLLKNFHCFKQKDLSVKEIEAASRLKSPFEPLFENIGWYNYFDKYDFISGRLDYYEKVKNMDATETNKKYRQGWKKLWFLSAHTDYWQNIDMYKELVTDFIYSQKPPMHVDGGQ